MPDINIVISTDSAGAVTGIQQVGGALGDLDGKAASASGGMSSLGSSLAGVVSTATGLIAGATAAAAMVDQVNQLGVSAIRARDGLNAMSGGQAQQYMDAMTQSTRGLVDNMTLASAATLALSTGVVHSAADMAHLAEDGAALGRVFQGDASAGIETFTRDLETVGNTRGLKQLGIDAQAVKEEFDKLKASGMDIQKAWNTAVFDNADATVKKLGDSAYGTGTALDKLKTQISNFAQSASANVAIGIEATINGSQAIFDHYITAQNFGSALGLKTTQMSDNWHPDVSNGIGSSGAQSGPKNYPGLTTFANQSPQDSNMQQMQGIMAQMQAARADASLSSVTAGAREGIDAGGIDNLRQMAEGAAQFGQKMETIAVNSARLPSIVEGWVDKFHQAEAAAQRVLGPIQDSVAAALKLDDIRSHTANQLLGAGTNNLASSIGGDMSNVLAGAKGTAQEKQAALDQYAIGTGQATAASIKFRDIQTDLNAKVTAGQLSISAYTALLLQENKAFEAGTTSMTDMYKMQQQIAVESSRAGATVTRPGANASDADIGHAAKATMMGASASGPAATDPYGPAKKSADDAKTSTDALATSATKVGPAAMQAGAQGVIAWMLTAGAANVASGQAQSVATNTQAAHTSMATLAPTAITAGMGMALGFGVANSAVSATSGLVNNIQGQLATVASALRDMTSHAWPISVTISGAINGSGETRGP